LTKRLIFAFIIICAAFALTACGETSPFEGRFLTWAGEPSRDNAMYEFKRNGTGVYIRFTGVQNDGGAAQGDHVHDFNWTTEDDVLEMHFIDSDEPLIYYFEVLENGDINISRYDWPAGISTTLMRLE